MSVCEKEKLVFVKDRIKHAADLDKDGGDLEKPYVVAHEPLAWLNSNSIKDKMKKTWASRRPSLM